MSVTVTVQVIRSGLCCRPSPPHCPAFWGSRISGRRHSGGVFLASGTCSWPGLGNSVWQKKRKDTASAILRAIWPVSACAPAVFRQTPNFSTDLRSGQPRCEEPGFDARKSNFYRTYLGTLGGRRRALIHSSVLAEVIVGQRGAPQEQQRFYRSSVILQHP